VKPHEKDNDGINYHCDIKLRDNNQVYVDVPVVAPRMGFACIPEEKDLVLVGFIRNKVDMPVILGTLYNDKVKPPVYHEGEAVYVCPASGKDEEQMKKLQRMYMELPLRHMKLIVGEEYVHYELEKYKFDLKMEEGIKLEVNEKTSLAISKEGDITITAKDTKISISKEGEIAIDSKQKVGIKTTADVSLESSGGNMKLSANKIAIEAIQAVEIKGATAKLESQGQLELKGAMAKVEATGVMDIKSSGVVNIKGSLVNIN
jgi:hypothetical protein